MGDFATLRFGPKNASRRVVFGHGVGGLDFSANTFIKGQGGTQDLLGSVWQVFGSESKCLT